MLRFSDIGVLVTDDFVCFGTKNDYPPVGWRDVGAATRGSMIGAAVAFFCPPPPPP